MKHSEDISIKDLTGITAFLNGQEGLHSMEEKLCKKFTAANKQTLIIDNLFDMPSKLKGVMACDNIVLSTTGTFADKLQALTDAFEKMKYAPKAVIFISENTALIFCGIARELKKKHGTKFYFPDIFSDELREINWI